MFKIYNKNFFFFMFFLLGISFLTLPSFADMIMEPVDHYSRYGEKLSTNVKSVQPIIFIVGGFVLLGLTLLALLKKIKWIWVIILILILSLFALAGAVVDNSSQPDNKRNIYSHNFLKEGS